MNVAATRALVERMSWSRARAERSEDDADEQAKNNGEKSLIYSLQILRKSFRINELPHMNLYRMKSKLFEAYETTEPSLF